MQTFPAASGFNAQGLHLANEILMGEPPLLPVFAGGDFIAK